MSARGRTSRHASTGFDWRRKCCGCREHVIAVNIGSVGSEAIKLLWAKEQMAALQGQLADVEASLSAAFDLMTKIDRDGMAARLESERLESETEREQSRAD